MRKLLPLVTCLGLFSANIFGQAVGDYRSFATGAWNNVNNWERFNGVWVNPAPGTPTSADGIITIMASHTINVPSGFSVTADQIEFDNTLAGNTGILVVDFGGTLTINNGAGNDVRLLNDFTTVALLQVAGTLQLNTGATLVDDDYGNLFIGPGPVSATTYSVLSGGVHIHTTGASVDMVPSANWQSGSTCQINATSGTVPSIANTIAFHHFIWNGSGQTALLNLLAGLTNINGDFTISSTNGQILQLSGATAYTLSIGRDFLIQNNSRVQFATTANPVVINVTRDFTLSSTNATANTISFNATGGTTLNVSGNFSKSGASILSMVLGTTGTNILNLNGNFSLTGGTITRNSTLGSASATINFNGASTKTFTNSGTISNAINFVIANGKTLDFGTSPMKGTGSFTLQGGGTMKVGSPDGLNISATALGNIQVSGTHTYAASSNIIYNGTTQNLGDEWGSTGALFGVAVNLEIASSGIVTNNITGSTSVVGKLTLTSGSFAIGDTNTLDVKGNFAGNGGTLSGHALSTSNMTFSSVGTITGNLTFAGGSELLNNFTISRAGTLALTSPLTISGILAFTSTGNLQFNAQTLTINGDITQSGAGGLISTVTTSNLVIGGSGALTALPFTGAMQLNNVTLGRTTGGAYTWNTAATVNGTLDLNSGTLTHPSGNLTMASGSTFRRSTGTSLVNSAPNASSSYNVIYIGALTTSLELPSSLTALNNLTTAGNTTLDKAIKVNGDLNINGGTLDAGSFDFNMAGANFLVNGGTFTINPSKTVTFSRLGTTVLGGVAIGGTQFGSVAINNVGTPTVLSAPNANINVSGTWTNSGTFTANSGSVTFNGAAQSLNPNGQAFNDVVFAGTSSKTLVGTLTANGTLTINSTLDVGANNLINVAGSWVNNGTFVAGGGLVNFNGAGQTINSNGQSFFNLTLAGSGTKTLGSAVTIGGVLTITGVTLDVSASSYPINLAGNWVNNGIFTRQIGTVTFNGTTTISGSSAASFHNVTISGALTSPSGTMDVSGNWLQSSGSFTHNSGTLQFSGNTQSITPGAQTFNNVTISGTNTKTLLGSTVVNGILTLSGGTFDTNTNALTLAGNFVSGSASLLTSSTIIFSGATALSGGTTPTFGGITIIGSLTPSTSFNVNGNLLNNGTLTANAGTVTFGGNTTISGSNACSFNDILISSTLAASSGTLNVAGTWTNNGTFTANGGTTVFNGTTSIAGSSSTNFANIVISGTLNGPATIGVGGNFTNNGTFNRGTGTVVFNGSSTQSISGVSLTDFNNITVSNNINSPAVQVQSNQNLRGVLTLSGTNTVFDADGSGNTSIFKLISTGDSPTVDAGIATLPVGTSVSGSVTVQRFMAIEGGNSTRIYRYISSPVSGAAVSQIQSFIPVTGTFTGASSCSGCGTSQSMFSYDETVIIGDLNTGYINFPAATNTETFVLGLGYSIYERGNVAPVSTAGNGRWELRGPINSGSVSLPVSFTSSGTAANDGWNLVGNPYPATIDWDAGGWTKTNINNALYMRDNGQLSPVYATYVGGAGSNGGSRYIATGQGFFVQANAASPVLQATEAVKVASQQTTFFREATEQKLIRIAMRQGIKSDEAVIRFTNESTNGFDSQWDAIKLTNPTSTSSPMFSFSSFGSDNAKYVINSLQQLSCGTTVKMDVSNATSGSYSLNFTQLESFPPTVTLLLKDAYTNASVDLKSTPSYSFTVDTSIPGTFGGGRFTIQFNVESDLPTSINAISKDFCSGQEGKLTIKGSKLGTSYSLFQEGKQIQDPMIGTGNDIQFALSKTIKAGISTIEVKASSLTCNTLSISQNILVNNVSLPVISSVTNSKNCNAGAVTLIAAGAPANGSYRWYGSKDSLEPIEGQTSEKFITPVLNKTKTYYVSTMNSLGCEGERKEVLAEIINYDNALITLVDSVTLSSNYDTGNQWYFEDKLIEGATGKTLKPEKTGVYKLKISTSGECSTSAERSYTVTEVKQKETPATITGLEESLPSHMTVYPNPTSSLLSIAVKSSNEVNAKLLTVLGTSLYNQPLEGATVKKGSFDMQDQADGIYILIVQDGDKIYKTRVIKKR